MATVLDVFRWFKIFFPQNPLTKDTAQMALFLVFNESANTKIAFCTYLKLTVSGSHRYYGHGGIMPYHNELSSVGWLMQPVIH